MTDTEIVIVSLGVVAVVVGIFGARAAAASASKTRNAPTLSFMVSLGRVVFAGGVALFLGSFAAVLHEPLGKEVDLVYALVGKVLGVAAALLGGYTEEHAKHSLQRLSTAARATPGSAAKTPVTPSRKTV